MALELSCPKTILPPFCCGGGRSVRDGICTEPAFHVERFEAVDAELPFREWLVDPLAFGGVIRASVPPFPAVACPGTASLPMADCSAFAPGTSAWLFCVGDCWFAFLAACANDRGAACAGG